MTEPIFERTISHAHLALNNPEESLQSNRELGIGSQSQAPATAGRIQIAGTCYGIAITAERKSWIERIKPMASPSGEHQYFERTIFMT